MTDSTPPADHAEAEVRTATEVAIRLAALGLLVVWCLHILFPFIGIVVWAFIVAVAATSPFERLVAWLGGRRNLAGAVFVLGILVLLIVPAVVLSESLVSGAQRFAGALEAGRIQVPPPPAGVSEMPVVGNQVYPLWREASENLGAVVERLRPQLEAMSRWLLAAAASAGVALVQFLLSLLISGAMLVRSEGRDEAVRRLASRISGGHGGEIVDLAESTIRSVVIGIIGVALIQSVLAGAAYLTVGIPAAGLWALLVLVAAVVQIPVVLVVLPPILIVASSESGGVAAAFAVWCLLVSFLDNVLKPILFGRGAQVPTLVIFLGAIGGMIAMGIVGLFVGAVVLALGYRIVSRSLDDALPASGPDDA